MLGCVPLITKERFSSDLLEEAINWSSVSIRVPPVDMPSLPHVLNTTDAEPLRRAAATPRLTRPRPTSLLYQLTEYALHIRQDGVLVAARALDAPLHLPAGALTLRACEGIYGPCPGTLGSRGYLLYRATSLRLH